MPHFHIPLQSGSDDVLKLMKRKYDTQLFANRVSQIKQLMPNAFIGVDVIVGVRGETEQNFNQTHQFLADLDISQLHVFTYSERPNTQALKIDEVVPLDERKKRSQLLHLLSDKKTKLFYRKYINTTATILLEGSEKDGFMTGYTANYIKAELPYDKTLINTLVKVQLNHLNLDGFSMVATKL